MQLCEHVLRIFVWYCCKGQEIVYFSFCLSPVTFQWSHICLFRHDFALNYICLMQIWWNFASSFSLSMCISLLLSKLLHSVEFFSIWNKLIKLIRRLDIFVDFQIKNEVVLWPVVRVGLLTIGCIPNYTLYGGIDIKMESFFLHSFCFFQYWVELSNLSCI